MIRSQAVPLAIPSPSFSRNAASFSLHSQQVLSPVSEGRVKGGQPKVIALARGAEGRRNTETHLFSRMFFSFCLL